MIKYTKKLNKISKLKISKTINFLNQDLTVEAQVSIIPCHLDDAIISNIPYTLSLDSDDFVRVNGEDVIYTPNEIADLLFSPEVKNLIMKEIVKKVVAS